MSTVKSFSRDKGRHSVNWEQSRPKKGGAGSKGVWGDYRTDIKYLGEDMSALDPKDPNYSESEPEYFEWAEYINPIVPESEESVVFRKKLEFSRTVISKSAFKSQVRKHVRDLMISHSTEDFLDALFPLASEPFFVEVPRLALLVGMDGNDEDRRVIGKSFQALLKHNLVTLSNISSCFLAVFYNLDSVLIDVPDGVSFLKSYIRNGMSSKWLEEKVGKELLELLKFYDNLDVYRKVKISATDQIAEFFTSHNFDEFRDYIKSVSSPFHHEIIRTCIRTSCDRSLREKELASRLLTEVVCMTCISAEIEKAFARLLYSVEDVVLDCPEFPFLLSCFIARAIIDDVLAPSFLSRVSVGDTDLAGFVVRESLALIRMPHSASRIARVWGSAATSSVQDLKRAFGIIIKEFFDSQDEDEVIRSLLELNVPSFHHEFVRRVFVISVDKSLVDFEAARKLVQDLVRKNVVTKTQFNTGVSHLRETINELTLDVPSAPLLLDRFLE